MNHKFSQEHLQSNNRGDRPAKNTEKMQEKEPKIIYNVLFAPHATAKDFAKLEENFKQCDIYVPETFGWSQSTFDRFNQVSQGKIGPEEARIHTNFSETLNEELRIIYQSKKPIVLIDASEKKAKEIKELIRIMDSTGEIAIHKFLTGNLEEAISNVYAYIDLSIEISTRRETIMKENLASTIKETIKNNPKLKNKSEIKVLISLGSMHTSFYHWLKKQYPSAHYKFNKSPYIYPYLNEAERRKLFKKEPNSDLLATRGIAETIISDYLEDFSDDNAKIFQIVRQLVSNLDLTDIKQIISKNNEQTLDIGELFLMAQQNIIARLKEKGVFVPSSKEEMDKIK